MTKSEAIAIFGSAAKVARALNISKAAVSEWGEEIPELRVYQIREILANREAEKAVGSAHA